MLSNVIAGVGSYTPAQVFKNDEFAAKGVDTSDEWIRTRTGISQRYFANESETVAYMAGQAARDALAKAGVAAKDIELIIVATFTPDHLMPSMAAMVQRELGVEGMAAMDLSAACSGFVYALSTADALMKARGYKTALVIGAEKLTSAIDWKDRTTCVLFGDGAGAVVLKAIDVAKTGVIDAQIGADGNLGSLLTLPKGGFIQMQGKEIFKHAVTVMGNSALSLLERNGIAKEEVACVIPHQANNRIIEAISERIKVPMEKFYVNVERYGNTSAASIPIALNEAVAAGRLKRGDWLLIVAFGGGLTWGAALIKWH